MEDLSTQQVLDLLTECSEMGAQNFHVFGGEPFLRDDLAEIIDFAYDLNLTLSIATNGTQLGQEDFSWLQRVNPFIGITFHGTKNFHDSFCKKEGSYDKALNALQMALKMKLNVGVITCVTQLNYTNYFSWMQSLVAMGVQTFFILYFSPLGRGKERTELQLTNMQWRTLHQTLMEYALQFSNRVNIYFETSISPKLSYPLYSHPPSFPCTLFTKTNCVVDANGDVYPCILFLRNPLYRLGNFKINSLHELWDRYQPGSRIIPEKCRDCQYIHTCNGGCPAYFQDMMDFRCDAKNIPLCPLYTEQL